MGDVLAVLFGIVLLVVSLFGLQDCKHRCDHWSGSCESRCKQRGEVHLRENGVCVCRDGSTWIWQEGYTRRLGGKP